MTSKGFSKLRINLKELRNGSIYLPEEFCDQYDSNNLPENDDQMADPFSELQTGDVPDSSNCEEILQTQNEQDSIEDTDKSLEMEQPETGEKPAIGEYRN